MAKSTNTLVIGDLHCPFDLDDYLQFNLSLYKKYKIDDVVFIGDVVDGHAWSYHEHDPDGQSAGDELSSAIKRLKRWYKAFPKAKITLGNHDLLIARKAFSAGLSQRFIRDLGEILEAPKTWQFVDQFQKDNVMYIHGSIGNAIKRAKESRISTVQGHLHSQSFVEWSVSERDKLFGLQVGCGIDRDAYAFAYGKPFAKKPIIGSGIILESGRLPFIELMDL